MHETVSGLPRFFAPELDLSESTAELPDEEGHHLARVMRLRRGARALLFDGRGSQVLAEVEAIDKAHVRLRILTAASAAAELDVSLTVAQAVLKGDKMDAVVRDATMLGVRIIQPVITARAVAADRSGGHASAVTRWHRVAVASAKQCGRAVVPAIAAPRRMDVVLEQDRESCRLILAEPSARMDAAPIGPPAEKPRSAVLLVGPEGGWTADELRAATERGWRAWSLGHTTLRADAAALVALGALSYAWGVGVSGPTGR